MMSMRSEWFQVTSIAPNSIQVEVVDVANFSNCKERMQLGSYLLVKDERDYSLVAIVSSYSVKEGVFRETEEPQQIVDPRIILNLQPLVYLDPAHRMSRGGRQLTLPPAGVELATSEILQKMYSMSSNDGTKFELGHLVIDKNVPVIVDGDRLLSKHIAVVGSTGSGKSCTVSSLLQQAVCGDKEQKERNNSHILIFDLHSEYKAAFQLKNCDFSLNHLTTDSLELPYWLMNSEELESMFIESHEANSHNQVSIFKQAVIENKRRHNTNVKDISYDAPVYFSIEQVLCFIDNLNREMEQKSDTGQKRPKLADGTLLDNRDTYFDGPLRFAESVRSVVTTGPFHGEFSRFVSRLETKLNDERLAFLLKPQGKDGKSFGSTDVAHLLRQFIGYRCKSNVTIVDLSGIPFEVLSITVSLVARLVFDFCFHYTKLRHDGGQTNDIPVLVVCEEAHQYIPRSDSAAYRASRRSIERIAKEGRKYGMNLMVVSQRPSEVSETIFAQCSNFLALRLTNSADQAYVRKLLPDNSSSITEALPTLSPGECLVIGDVAPLPALVNIAMPVPRPHSDGVAVHSEWKVPWRDVTFDDVVQKWLNNPVTGRETGLDAPTINDSASAGK